MHECPYCHAGIPLLEMDSHVLRCPAAKAAGAKPTGASAALARRLDNHSRGIPQAGEGRAVAGGGNGMDGIPEFADDDDCRIACQVCGRKFTMDRIGKHQAICERLAGKKPRRKFLTQREYVEGGAGGTVVGTAKHMNKPNPEPLKSNWRKESSQWREACRAARSDPLPPWGSQSSGPPRRGSPSPPPARGDGRRSPVARGGGASPTRRTMPRSSGPEGRSASPTPPAACARAPALAATRAPVASRGLPAAATRAPPAAARAPVAKVVGGFAAVVVKEQFRLLDANGDGRLDPEELSALLRSGDANMTDEEMGSLFESIDKDQNGRIDFAEFVDFIFSEEGGAPSPAGDAGARCGTQRGPIGQGAGGVASRRSTRDCRSPLRGADVAATGELSPVGTRTGRLGAAPASPSRRATARGSFR